MAEMQFSVLAVSTSLKTKSIFIECNFDVDENTVSNSSIVLLNKTANTIELFESEVDGRIIQVKLKSDPQPGDSYSILIQNGIESVVGDKLDGAMMRNLVFESEVVSEIEIISPANFEKIGKLKLSWKEIGSSLTNESEWQIAKENGFYNICYQTKVQDATSIELPHLEDGQYYFRGRAIKGEDYGRWSEVRTFLYHAEDDICPVLPGETTDPVDKDPTKIETSIDNGDPLIIVEQEDLTLDDFPKSGVTPKEAFAFAFNEDIDLSNAEIRMYRSDF